MKNEAVANALALDHEEDHWISRYTLPVNGPDPVIHVFLCTENQPIPIPKVGLCSSTLHYRAFLLRPQDHNPIPLTLASETADDGQCKFWEVDPDRVPGLYGLQIPSSLRPKGYTYLYLHFPETHPHYLEFQGVCYDPYDAFAIGLETWIRSSCHENLSSGLRKSMPSVLRPLLAEWLIPHA